ncbi:MAG: DUF4097 family beta strand repeat protein [Verrucomicrobia bacterium]|nr:DUF4097 family beta strand repeat protein [Verrucomicrobiota bacterium]
MCCLILPRPFLTSVVMVAASVGTLPAEETATTARYSRPELPGTLKVLVGRGTLDIQGTDTQEIRVRSNTSTPPKAARKDGLRVLTATSSPTLSEKDNVVTLDATGEGWPAAGGTFVVEVPRQSSVVVQNSWGGDIKCRDVAGDVEITGMNGTIDLGGLSGGVAVSTMNGEIRAEIRALREGKALSFQSMNGEVTLRLPENAKASFKVRTQNGSVLTDFEESVLATKTENLRAAGASHVQVSSGSHSVIPPEAREAIREAARVGAEAVREAAVAIREAAEAAREGAEVSRSTGTAPIPPKVPVSPRAPRAPKIVTMPTITGGKLVTGSLNGGGTEISVATMNGDIILRRARN